MARAVWPSAKEEAAYRAWVETRPGAVRAVAERLDPWSLYRIKSSGERGAVFAFCDRSDGSVRLTILVMAEFNPEMVPGSSKLRTGVDPADLEECDVPISRCPHATLH